MAIPDSMMLPPIGYKDRKILYMADLRPSIGHSPRHYVMVYDMLPLQTLQDKKAILNEAKKKLSVIPGARAGKRTLYPAANWKGVKLREPFKLSELQSLSFICFRLLPPPH
jgi:hypothetical protein